MFCIHAKVGTCTWKTILANNSAKAPIKQTPIRQFHYVDVKSLNSKKYSIDDIKYRLKHYYKVMVVRHPFDRYVYHIL